MAELEELFNIVLKRYEAENIKLSDNEKDNIFFSLAGTMKHQGFSAAKNYALTARLKYKEGA